MKAKLFLAGVALGALSLYGGEVIRSFTLSMIFGILVGTYSSVFVAGPLLILFKLRPDAFDAKEETKLPTAQPRAT